MLWMGPTNAWWSFCEGDKYTGCYHGCLSISVGSFLSLRSLFFLAPLSPCISIFDYCVGYLYASIPNFGTLAASKHKLPNMLTHLSALVKTSFEDTLNINSRWLTGCCPPTLKRQLSVKDFMTNHYLHHFHFHTLKNSSKSYVWHMFDRIIF